MTISAMVWDFYNRILAELSDLASVHGVDAHNDLCFRGDDHRTRNIRITCTPDGILTFFENGFQRPESKIVTPIIEAIAKRLQAEEDARKALVHARMNYVNLRRALGNTYFGSLCEPDGDDEGIIPQVIPRSATRAASETHLALAIKQSDKSPKHQSVVQEKESDRMIAAYTELTGREVRTISREAVAERAERARKKRADRRRRLNRGESAPAAVFDDRLAAKLPDRRQSAETGGAAVPVSQGIVRMSAIVRNIRPHRATEAGVLCCTRLHLAREIAYVDVLATHRENVTGPDRDDKSTVESGGKAMREFARKQGTTSSPDQDFSRSPIRLQAKLAVNTPGDRYEQEADHVAGRVMSMPQPMLQRKCACGGGCSKCRNEQAAHGHLQTKRVEPAGDGATSVPLSVQEVTRSSAEPLDPATREFMEPRFGYDFSQVRVHTDARAQESARDVNAHAYTVGRNIVFAAGQYSPDTHAGRQLLAHELTHVVQQSAGQPTAAIQRDEDERNMAEPANPTSPQADTMQTPVSMPAPASAAGGPTAEITLETGNFGAGFLNDLVHQQICISGYGTDVPKRCFSFAASGMQAPQFSWTWLGWSSWVTGAVIQGEVYEPDPVSTATVVSRHTPTQAQGSTWLNYMTGTRLGLHDGYSVGRHNCRMFSQLEFTDAPSHW